MMRTFRTLFLSLFVVLALVLASVGVASATPATSNPRTYTVMVGLENSHQGVEAMAYFPETVTIHVGDTVRWLQNTVEIHTVTFLGGQPMPELIVPGPGLPSDPSPVMFNPLVVYPTVPAGGLGDQTTFVNSGLMGRDAGQVRVFRLTFTAAGTYDYVCLVHGVMMHGSVRVVSPDSPIASPWRVAAQARHQMARVRARVPAVQRAAAAQVQPPVGNPDGTMTHTVAVGFGQDVTVGSQTVPIDLMRFFPSRVLVRPGDTVIWRLSASNDAPHTVTFLNGTADPALLIPVAQASGPPLLFVNPAVLFPSQPSPLLLRSGYFNSGILQPLPAMYSLVVGDVTPGPLPYVCLVHDDLGMRGSLVVRGR